MPAPQIESSSDSDQDCCETLTSQQMRELIATVRQKCLAQVDGAFDELESIIRE